MRWWKPHADPGRPKASGVGSKVATCSWSWLLNHTPGFNRAQLLYPGSSKGHRLSGLNSLLCSQHLAQGTDEGSGSWLEREGDMSQ